MAKKVTPKISPRQRQINYWEQLHHALERDITRNPPSGSAMKKAISDMEVRLMRTPGGDEGLYSAQVAAGMLPEVEVSFNVHGYCTQQVQIVDRNITPEKLYAGLASGKFVTTVQEGGEVIVTKTGKRIGIIQASDMNAEYDDFTVEFQG